MSDEELKSQLSKFIAILEEVTDDDECEYHDGYCQVHYHDEPCAHERAREMLGALDGTGS